MSDSVNYINVQEDKLDLFESPYISTDIVSNEYALYQADQGETYTEAKSSGYRIETKDLDAFLGLNEAVFDLAVGAELTIATPVAQRAGVALAAGAAGVQFLPAVAAPANAATLTASLQDINDALAVRKDFDGKPTLAVGIPNPFKLFSRARLLCNGVEIQDVNNPGHIAEMKILAYGSRNQAEILEEMSGIFMPKNWTPENVVRKTSNDELVYQLPLSLIFSFFGPNFKYTRGMRWTIELTPNSNMYDLLQQVKTNDPANLTITAPKVYVKRLRLYVPIIKPSNPAIYRYEKSLQSSEKSIQLFDGFRYFNSKPENNSSAWHVVTEDKHIKKLFIWCSNTKKSSTHVDNGGYRGLEELTDLRVRINSNIIPKEQIKFNLTTGDAMKAYNEFLGKNGKSPFSYYSGGEPILSYSDWLEKQTIFCFEVPQEYSVYDAKTFDVNIEATLSAALGGGDQYQIHCIIQTEDQVAIETRDNRVSLSLTRGEIIAGPPAGSS